MAKKKPTKKKDELFFVGVRNPIDVRRNILESTKEFVQVLQMYGEYSKLRQEIVTKTEKLQKDISKIKNLNSRLKKLLPDTGLRAIPTKSKKIKLKQDKKEHKPKQHKPKSELDELEAELNMIENKLNKMN